MFRRIVLLLLFCCLSQLSAQELSVFSGFWADEYFQDDVQITRQEAKSLLLEYEGSSVYWKKKAANETLYYLSLVAQLGATFWAVDQISKEEGDRDIAAPLTLLGTVVLNAIFLTGTAKNKKKAVLAYNKQFDSQKTTSYRLVPIGNSNGIGLALQF